METNGVRLLLSWPAVSLIDGHEYLDSCRNATVDQIRISVYVS